MTKYFQCAVAVIVWGCLTTACQAQFKPKFGAGVPGPAVSPYLNLLRGGNPAINYYGLVRPQVAAGKAFESLGADVKNLEANSSQVVQTGHRSSFMTQGRYFMNNGNPRAPRTGAAAGPQTGAARR